MTDENVGYKRPPKSTRWPKGKSGNPNRVRHNPPKRMYRIIEEVLSKEIDILENRTPRRVTVLEAILMQLWKKTVSGNKRALRAMRKYEVFAKAMPDTYVHVQNPNDPEMADNEFRRLIGAL